MKTGDKIEFTPEQRAALLPLFAGHVYLGGAARAAGEEAERARIAMWRTITETLGLEKGRAYTIAEGFSGVIAHAEDRETRPWGDDKALQDYEDLRTALLARFAGKETATPPAPAEPAAGGE